MYILLIDEIQKNRRDLEDQQGQIASQQIEIDELRYEYDNLKKSVAQLLIIENK